MWSDPELGLSNLIRAENIKDISPGCKDGMISWLPGVQLPIYMASTGRCSVTAYTIIAEHAETCIQLGIVLGISHEVELPWSNSSARDTATAGG
jgi:hypothetical protein